MVISRSSRRQGQAGAAAVEFALVAPLLLVVVFGILSYGYMLSFRQSMSQGADEGARAAAIAPPQMSEADRTARARASISDALSNYGVSCTSTNVTCTVAFAACADSAADRCATVAVSYPYRSGTVGPKFPGMGIVLPETLEFRTVVQVAS